MKALFNRSVFLFSSIADNKDFHMPTIETDSPFLYCLLSQPDNKVCKFKWSWALLLQCSKICTRVAQYFCFGGLKCLSTEKLLISTINPFYRNRIAPFIFEKSAFEVVFHYENKQNGTFPFFSFLSCICSKIINRDTIFYNL